LMDELRSSHAASPTVRGSAAVAQQLSPLDVAIGNASDAIKSEQDPAGYWCYEFEADCTIPSEYILMLHFMGRPEPDLERKIAVYLLANQREDGSWSLYPGGAADISCSVKCYFALKLAGEDIDSAHMRRAREFVLSQGGAAQANVFTRITLALFGEVPWRAVPFIPVEIMLLPQWFPFHLTKVAYWSRVVMVPLFILCTLKPRAENPDGVNVRELFVVAAQDERNYFVARSRLNRVFFALDRLGRLVEPLIPGFVRRHAIKRATEWFVDRLNGVDGLGAIFPAMVNAHEALKALGYSADHPLMVQSGEALRRLLVVTQESAYCQPCVSPVWDTGLACLALQQSEGRADTQQVMSGLNWLKERQLLDEPGDWQWSRPQLRGGGWAFEFANDYYPDIDDTPVVAWAMLNTGDQRFHESIARAAEWLVGMQSRNGGWASFDVDNTHYYLNEIPFADHGALLDPPTVDVTSRCITFLSHLDRGQYAVSIERGLAFLRDEQEISGCWFGRWGTNYIYGTWSVLVALEAAGIASSEPMIQRAVKWLKNCQRNDGGWGEDNLTYYEPQSAGTAARSTSFQTAWAILGLLSAGEVRDAQVSRGIEFLLDRQQNDGLWSDHEFTAPGFPRVFYLKYHGYQRYFPLWALARFRELYEVA
jgi:squalene-hopene/tetraprenyl-beta-curcumene cyclase